MKDTEKTKGQLISELADLRKQAESKLNERVKELQCLYGLSRIVEKPGITLDEIYQEAVNHLPMAWQYPEIACARISIGGRVFCTENFKETRWKQSADIKVAGAGAGQVELCYLKERPEVDEGPFLAEERRLLDVVTERLGRITERKQEEEALRKSEERHRAISEIASDFFHSSNLEPGPHRGMDWLAGRFQEITGYSPDEITDFNAWHSKIHPDDVDRLRKNAEKIFANKPVATEYRFIDKQGDVRWLYQRTQPVWDEEKQRVTRLYSAVTDITERKRAEEELKKERDRAEGYLNIAGVMLATIDADEKISLINRRGCEILGYQEGELTGKNWFDTLVPGAMRGDARGVFSRLMAGDIEPVEYYETPLLTRDGEERLIAFHNTVLRDPDGQAVGVLLSGEDITERRKAEAEKKEMEQRAQMASRLASVGEMASGVAHEINNPLVGVIGFAQLLEEREDIPEDAKEQLKIIQNGGQRVASIVKRLLSFARQGKPEKSYVSVNELIEATLKLRPYEMKTASIELVTRLDPDLPWTMADGGQLQQVFLNLILNAEQAMSLAHGRGKLTVRTELKDESIRVSFKDDGPGIAKESIEKIFNPFFTTREVGQGTGLGLSICHGIMAEHKGQVYVKSKPGKGATFVVKLPVVTEEWEVEMAEPAGEAEKVGKAKILVVDDEPINLKYLSHLLGGKGHEVDTVDNGAEALEMARKGNYDLVLTDIKMPGMSGIELYQSLQEAVPSSVGKVVFITGDVMGTETQAFLSRSAAPRVSKPFDNKQLKKVINRALTETRDK